MPNGREWEYDPKNGVRMTEEPCPLHETWGAMEELVDKGLTKAIGVSNMGTTAVRDICSYARIQPAVLQVEIHPYNVQANLVRMCQDRGIQVTAYSSFGAMSYVDLERHKCGIKDTTFDHPTIKAVAEKTGKSPA